MRVKRSRQELLWIAYLKRWGAGEGRRGRALLRPSPVVSGRPSDRVDHAVLPGRRRRFRRGRRQREMDLEACSIDIGRRELRAVVEQIEVQIIGHGGISGVVTVHGDAFRGGISAVSSDARSDLLRELTPFRQKTNRPPASEWSMGKFVFARLIRHHSTRAKEIGRKGNANHVEN